MGVSVDEVYALASALDGADRAAAAAAYAQLLAAPTAGAPTNALVADVLVQHHAQHAAHTAPLAVLLVRLARDPLAAARLAALRGLPRVCCAPATTAPSSTTEALVPASTLHAAATALVRAACAVAPAEHDAAAAALATLAAHCPVACAEAAVGAVHAAAAAPADSAAAAPPVCSLVAVLRDSVAPAVLPALYGTVSPEKKEKEMAVEEGDDQDATVRQWAALLLGLLADEGVGAEDARVVLALLLRLPQYAPHSNNSKTEAGKDAEDVVAVCTLLRVLLCRAGIVGGVSEAAVGTAALPLCVRTDAAALARTAAWLPLVADVAVRAPIAVRRTGTATALVAQLYTPALVAACAANNSTSTSTTTSTTDAAEGISVPPACSLPLLRALVDLVPAVDADTCRALFPTAVALLCATVPAGAHDLDNSNSGSSNVGAVRYTTCECALLLLRRVALRVPGALRRHCGVDVPAAQPCDAAAVPDPARYADLRARLAFLRATCDATVAELARVSTKKKSSKSTGPSADATEVARRVTASIRGVLGHMLHAAPFVQPRDGSAAAAAAWWQQEQREQQRAEHAHALPPSWRMTRAPPLPVVRTVVLARRRTSAPVSIGDTHAPPAKAQERATDEGSGTAMQHEEGDHDMPPQKRRLSEQ